MILSFYIVWIIDFDRPYCTSKTMQHYLNHFQHSVTMNNNLIVDQDDRIKVGAIK